MRPTGKWEGGAGASSGASASEVRERLQLAESDCRERIERSKADIARCLRQGLAWAHPNVITHRARLAAALAELELIQLVGGAA